MEIVYCDFDWASVFAILLAGGIGLFKHLSSKAHQQEKELPVEETFSPEEVTVADYKKSLYQPLSDNYSRDIFMEEEEEESEELEELSGDYYSEALFSNKKNVVSSTNILSLEEIEEETEAYDFDIRKAIISSEILKRPEF